MPHATTLRRLLLASLLSATSFSQQPPAPDAHIHLDVIVTPKNGDPISGLKQSDFTLLDNKVPQQITSFRQLGKETPIEVILVIDSVNTPFSTVAYERQQIDRFLHSNEGALAQPTTLAILTDQGIKTQGGATRDGNILAQDLDAEVIGLRSIGRSTGFYGAEERLGISLKSLSLLIAREQPRPGRKLLVFVSPGWPVFSGARTDLSNNQHQEVFSQVVQLSDQLRQARTTLYAVNPLGTDENLERAFSYEPFIKGVSKPNQTDIGDLSLQVLALQSGGLVLQGSNDIAALLQRAMNDATPAYELTYTPPPAELPLEYHTIEIKLAQPGVTARTRQGYYARPSPTTARP